MKKLVELLIAAEAEAKQLADANPKHGAAQALRARTRSALDLAQSPALADLATAPAASPAK